MGDVRAGDQEQKRPRVEKVRLDCGCVLLCQATRTMDDRVHWSLAFEDCAQHRVGSVTMDPSKVMSHE